MACVCFIPGGGRGSGGGLATCVAQGPSALSVAPQIEWKSVQKASHLGITLDAAAKLFLFASSSSATFFSSSAILASFASLCFTHSAIGSFVGLKVPMICFFAILSWLCDLARVAFVFSSSSC